MSTQAENQYRGIRKLLLQVTAAGCMALVRIYSASPHAPRQRRANFVALPVTRKGRP
jgi:hypothetical protein